MAGSVPEAPVVVVKPLLLGKRSDWPMARLPVWMVSLVGVLVLGGCRGG